MIDDFLDANQQRSNPARTSSHHLVVAQLIARFWVETCLSVCIGGTFQILSPRPLQPESLGARCPGEAQWLDGTSVIVRTT
jgi:hypothetical protein